MGKKDVIARIKRNPLNRALRIDKMTLAALEATLRLYLDEALARQHVPTLSMITASPAELRRRAMRLAARLRRRCGSALHVNLIDGESRVGGGSFPENGLPTTLIRLECELCTPEQLKTRLLSTSTPLIGRLEGHAFLLDPRTLSDDEFSTVATVMAEALATCTTNKEQS